MVKLHDLPSAAASAERVAKAAAAGQLDPKIAGVAVFAINAAIGAHRAQAEIERRDQKRLEEMSDSELDTAFDRALEAHLTRVRSDGA